MTKRTAFSLVELSIVLVILGLLTGGILTGQSLIRAAELRSVTTEFKQYQTAIMTFKERFFAIPGDMRNATDFWGAADGGDGIGSDCQGAETSDSTTCNGDGDGLIELGNNANTTREVYMAWKHLANSGLVTGNFAAIRGDLASCGGTGSNQLLAGCNMPTAKAGGGGMWMIQSEGNVTSDTWLFDGQYGTMLIIGKADFEVNRLHNYLSVEESWHIDKKMDDGKPGLGKVRVTRPRCIASGSLPILRDAPESGVYDVLASTIDDGCGLLFITN